MKFYHKASDGQCVAAESSGYCRFTPAMAPVLALCVWNYLQNDLILDLLSNIQPDSYQSGFRSNLPAHGLDAIKFPLRNKKATSTAFCH